VKPCFPTIDLNEAVQVYLVIILIYPYLKHMRTDCTENLQQCEVPY